VYDGEMVVIAARIGAGPSDNRQVVASEFELRPSDDCDMRGFLWRLKQLSGSRADTELANEAGGKRQPRKQSIHRNHGIMFGPGRGGTPQIAGAQGGSGGAVTSNSLPWVAAVPPVMH